jgi:hypothetical protein
VEPTNEMSAHFGRVGKWYWMDGTSYSGLGFTRGLADPWEKFLLAAGWVHWIAKLWCVEAMNLKNIRVEAAASFRCEAGTRATPHQKAGCHSLRRAPTSSHALYSQSTLSSPAVLPQWPLSTLLRGRSASL